MPKARKTLVSLDATPYYHCVSRCVRRAFLCGDDPVSGQSYEHRRQWIEDKILSLGQIFSIDIATYAVMHNHYHVLLHVDKTQAEQWSVREVIEHWHLLFKGHLLSQRYLQNESLTRAEVNALDELVVLWRKRLTDISWFMWVLNEGIAREANKEDCCTGRFWEGRFKSQAILDESALAACMAYIDLNPIRAGLAKTPETSIHTSIKKRIKQACTSKVPNRMDQQPPALLPFVGNPREDMPKGLPFCLTDYIELVDWTGRIIREDKKGSIPKQLPPVLARLGIEVDNWIYLTEHFESPFKSLVGTALSMRRACEALGQNWVHGVAQCERLFSSG
jgi:REP element-mobilizing transposase RayT